MLDGIKTNGPETLWERYFSPALLTTAVTILLLCGLVIYRNVKTFAETAKWVSHTREVLGNIESVATAMTEAESSARGFWISGDEKYRQQFDHAADEVTRVQSELKRLTADNPEQQSRLGDLYQLIDPVLSNQRQFMSSRSNGSVETKIESALMEAAAEIGVVVVTANSQ